MFFKIILKSWAFPIREDGDAFSVFHWDVPILFVNFLFILIIYWDVPISFAEESLISEQSHVFSCRADARLFLTQDVLTDASKKILNVPETF